MLTIVNEILQHYKPLNETLSTAKYLLQTLTYCRYLCADMNSFAAYLHELRKSRGLSLKQVEAKAGVSNAYLSQLERGLRKPPHPDILRRLATAYEVPVEDLLVAAGYLGNGAEKGITREAIEKAFAHVISDPQFRHGTRIKGVRLGPDAKRFIVEVYEKLSGRKLLQPE